MNVDVKEVINTAIQCRGITLAELCRRGELQYELIRRTFHGNRHLTADEFISVCKVLGLGLEDFK